MLPFALHALHIEPAVMALQGMLHDREPEPRAAAVARAPRIDAIEPFRQAWDVFGGDADAVVDDGKIAALLVGPPSQSARCPRKGCT